LMQKQQNRKLDKLFMLQKLFQQRLINDGKYPQTVDGQVGGLCTAIIHEAVELQRLTAWKWWKKPQPIDYTKAREELADIWHFVIDLSLVLGMTPELILEEYHKKNLANHQRQDVGY